jgi:hypothetical protein
MTAPRLIPPTAYRRVPWKNGLGSTLELATDAAAPGGAWTWRLSVADVPARAAFSHFPGIDRHLACLDGAGLELTHVGQTIAIPREGTAFSFAGEDSIEGAPLGEGVRDINLMLDRACWRGAMQVVRHPRDARPLRGDVVLVHATPGGGDVRVTSDGENTLLSAGHTLIATAPTEIQPQQDDCALVACELIRIGTR